jgi:DNA-binding response OmpR family regulator
MSDAPVAIFNSSEDTIEMLKMLLEHRGHRVVWGHTDDVVHGRLDFDAFITKHDACALMWDIAPPYDQNWQFLQNLLARSSMNGRGIVVTTTHKKHLDRLAGESTGAFEIIGKPYDMNIVAEAIEAACQSRQRVEAGTTE